jgi:transposase
MEARTQNAAPTLTTIGLDIGKDVFHIVGFDADGKIALRRKIKRLALAETFKKLPPCVVGMEACLSAHFVSRTLRALGHEPRIRNRPSSRLTRGRANRLASFQCVTFGRVSVHSQNEVARTRQRHSTPIG